MRLGGEETVGTKAWIREQEDSKNTKAWRREESSGGVGQIREEVTKRRKTDNQGPEQCVGPE